MILLRYFNVTSSEVQGALAAFGIPSIPWCGYNELEVT